MLIKKYDYKKQVQLYHYSQTYPIGLTNNPRPFSGLLGRSHLSCINPK